MKNLIVRNSNHLEHNRNWSPLDEVETLINRFFNSYQPYQGEDGIISMPIELVERDDNYIVKIMTPGIKKEDLNVDVSEDQVNVSGVCKVEYEQNKDLIHRSEFCKGNFSRTITLPQKINNQKVKADYKDGVLSLTLPKSEQSKHKMLRITL